MRSECAVLELWTREALHCCGLCELSRGWSIEQKLCSPFNEIKTLVGLDREPRSHVFGDARGPSALQLAVGHTRTSGHEHRAIGRPEDSRPPHAARAAHAGDPRLDLQPVSRERR